MATIVTRAGKGSPLTHNEVDANFVNLNTGKAETASPALTGNPTITSNSTTPALTITQTGTGAVLLVEDSTSPDATPFVIDTDGRINSGSTTAYYAGTVTPRFQVNTTSVFENLPGGFGWGVTPISVSARSAGTSVGTHTSVVSGNLLWSQRIFGSDGTSFVWAASIDAAVDGTPGTNDMPGRLTFSTTADGASIPTERMRIDSAGNVGIGTSSPAAKFAVTSPANSPSLVLTDATQSTLTIKHETGNLLTYDTAGTAIQRWVLNSTERFRIDSLGAFGIGGANYGTSGQVLTSGGSGAAPSWQTGGNQVFTASGTITAGDIVEVNSDGTVSKAGITTNVQDKSYNLAISQRDVATANTYNVIGFENSGYVPSGIISISDTTFVSAHTPSGLTSCVARIVTVASDGTATFGSDFTAISSTAAVDNIVKVSSNSFAILHRPTSTTTAIIIGQVSGSTITFGSSVTFQSGLTYTVTAALSNGSGTLLLVGNTGGTNTPLRAYAVSVSGTTVTVGSAFTLRSAAPSAQRPTIAYDSVNNVFVANAVMISSPFSILSYPISISGTTISGGTQYNVFGAENSYYDRSRIIYHPDAGRFIAINPYATGTTQKNIYSATVSSLVITASPANATLHFNSSDFFFLTIDGTLLFIDGYGSNIYSVSYDSANSYKPVLTLLTYSHPLIIGNFTYTAIGNSGIYALLSTAYNSAIITDEKVTTLAFSSIYRYIGSANQSVSNGQSVRTAVSGGIATNLSGLTTGLRYSVSANGSIVPSTSALALATYGTALSATTLLLNPTLVM